MKKFIFLVILLLATVWSYFYYVRGENLVDQILGHVDPNKHEVDYLYALRKDKAPHWETAAPMIGMRVNVAAAAVGEKIYVIGGNDAFGRTVPTVEAFDVKLNSWSRVADLPKALHDATAASDGKKVYVFGGMTGIPQTPVNSLYVFDPEKGAWEEGPPPGHALANAAVAYLDGSFHVLGGLSLGESSQLHSVFNPAAGQWTTAEPIVSGRDHFTAENVDGRLCIFGGRGGSLVYNLNEVDCQAVGGGPWDQAEPMPAKRSALGTEYIGGTVYAFGGEASTAAFGELYKWDPKADKWTEDVPMPTARHGFGYAQVNGRIYVFGGGRRAGFSVSDVSEVYTP